MTKVTRKPWQPRRVAMRFASRMKGKKKTLCQWRYRGSVKVRWFHLHSPCYSLTLLLKSSTLPLPGTKALISPHPFFMKSPFQFSFYALSSKQVTFCCLYRHEKWPWGSEDLYKEPWKRKSDHMPLSWRRWGKQESQSVFFCSCACKKLNQSKKSYQNMKQSHRRKQSQKRRQVQPPQNERPWRVQPGQPVTE